MTEKSTYAASAQATQIDNAPQFIDLTSLNESLPPETQMMYTHTTVQGGASGGKLCSFKHSIIFIVNYFRFALLTTCLTSNSPTYAIVHNTGVIQCKDGSPLKKKKKIIRHAVSTGPLA